MHTTATPVQIGVIEKLREEELEEARSIQSVMLPEEPLRTGGVSTSACLLEGLYCGTKFRRTI